MFKNKIHLKLHIKRHEVENRVEKEKARWSCVICGRVFKKEKHLRLHALTHDRRKQEDNIVDSRNEIQHTIKNTTIVSKNETELEEDDMLSGEKNIERTGGGKKQSCDWI